jgi:hypothetical protein
MLNARRDAVKLRDSLAEQAYTSHAWLQCCGIARLHIALCAVPTSITPKMGDNWGHRGLTAAG